MDKYRPSYRITFEGLILLLLTMIVVGAIAGGIVAFVSVHLYLVVLFPLLMGMVAGGAVALVVKTTRVRNPFLAAFAGILTGLAIYGVYQVGAYLLFRQSTIQDMITQGATDPNRASAAFDQVLQRRTGTTGFIGFLKYTAASGISIVPTDSASDTPTDTLKGTAVYVYWGLELLGIVFIAAALAIQPARQPFCENCNTWYAGRGLLGSVERKQSREFVKLLKSGQFVEAKALFGTPQKFPYTNLEMAFCKTCQTSPIVVTARQVVRRSRNGSILARGALSRDQIALLLPVSRATGGSVAQ